MNWHVQSNALQSAELLRDLSSRVTSISKDRDHTASPDKLGAVSFKSMTDWAVKYMTLITCQPLEFVSMLSLGTLTIYAVAIFVRIVVSTYVSSEKCNKFQPGAEGGVLCLCWSDTDSCRLNSLVPAQKWLCWELQLNIVASLQQANYSWVINTWTFSRRSWHPPSFLNLRQLKLA